ncbi:MAG: hypothetical protein HN742_16545 [Lentisphaerae bacterium]|nr:hypothetical protein [Lentisphaerota bacterium]MBT4816922.1 hypothetical protein [Lentisphaerota bacterium]MBT5609384.1 hypothetical protein [Lentisphaerota bacterium]MBT7060796.1 hypothetical protein [Lentisphaerota bacterium]MBT7843489.1 hypothetical protein [Lentisphaerota bacterium]
MIRRMIPLFAVLIGMVSCQHEPVPSVTQLPPVALMEKARLESLFGEVAKRYPCEVKDQVNEMIPRIHTVAWAEDLGEVNGEMRIPVPPDMVRVWKLFNDLRFYGSGLGKPGQAIHFETPTGNHEYGFWRDKDMMLAGHSNRMRPTDDTYEGYTIVVKGRGRIDRVVLRSNHGVSAKFDDNPWSTLGKDKPIKRVKITVDATRRRAIAGSVRLEREKFWRIPSHDGTHPDGIVAATYCAGKGFLPGRGIWKLDGLTRWGIGGLKLKEDALKPGKPDYTAMAGLTLDADAKTMREAAFPRDFRQANCFDNWPPFMALKGTRVKNHRGTPADFHEAAKLASAAIGWQKATRGNADHWWEVKNESTITDEWVLHAEEGVDSWGELARFHNIMADTIHGDHPEVLVGGPTSAWMALHHGDFGLGRKQLRFMDETRAYLDFYSHHFYEGKQLILSEGDAFSGGYLMGRLEGCLDLLRNHMELTGNVKPMLVTETGTLADRNSEMGIWLNTKNMSSYLVRYMNQADKLDLVSLWLIPYVWWDKHSHSLFNKGEDGKLTMDPKVGYFLDLWTDYRGDRLPSLVVTRDTNVHLHSVIDGNTIWVAINNLNPYRIHADLSLMAGSAKPVRVEQLRLYFDGGKVHFETVEHAELSAFPVAVEETSLIKIRLDRPSPATATLDERTFYGDKVLQPTGQPVVFSVKCPAGDIAQADLRICVSRDGGFSRKMTVVFNDRIIRRRMVITPQTKPGNYWGYVTVSVPPELVQRTNTVSVSVPEERGYVTTVALINAYTTPAMEGRE